jgi:hypothetical protein
MPSCHFVYPSKFQVIMKKTVFNGLMSLRTMHQCTRRTLSSTLPSPWFSSLLLRVLILYFPFHLIHLYFLMASSPSSLIPTLYLLCPLSNSLFSFPFSFSFSPSLLLLLLSPPPLHILYFCYASFSPAFHRHLILHSLFKYSIQNNGRLRPETGAVISIIPLIWVVATTGVITYSKVKQHTILYKNFT